MQLNIKTETLALGFACLGLLSNFMMMTWEGVPVSIPFGIMAIAIALTSREEKKLPKKASIAIAVAIVALLLGFLIYAILFFTWQMMSDPEASHEILVYVEEMMQNMPEDMQEKMRAFYHL